MYLDEFRKYLTDDTQFKPQTINSYCNTVKNFLLLTDDDSTNQDFKIRVRKYLLEQSSQQSISTLNTNISVLKKYILFLYSDHPEVLGDYHLSNLPKKRRGETLPKYITDYDLQRVILVMNNLFLFSPAEKFVLRLFINHGLKPVELMNLRLDNIDFQKGMVIYRGDDDEVLRLMVLIKSDFQCFIAYLNSSDYDIENPSLVQIQGKTITRHKIKQICDKASEQSKVKVTPTILRNTFIRQCLENGMSEVYVQFYMGFSSISALEPYQKINLKVIADEYKPLLERVRASISDSGNNFEKVRAEIVQIYKDFQSKTIRDDEEPLIDLKLS